MRVFFLDSASGIILIVGQRHLSHLIGLYPGYAISNFAGQTNNTQEEILKAAEISLIHRGNGTGPDADAGWEKVWRAAAWAQLNNASTFYHELTVRRINDARRKCDHLYQISMLCNVILDPIFFLCTIRATQIPYSKLMQIWDTPVLSL